MQDKIDTEFISQHYLPPPSPSPPQPTLTSRTESISTAAVLTGTSDINRRVHVTASFIHTLINLPTPTFEHCHQNVVFTSVY